MPRRHRICVPSRKVRFVGSYRFLFSFVSRLCLPRFSLSLHITLSGPLPELQHLSARPSRSTVSPSPSSGQMTFSLCLFQSTFSPLYETILPFHLHIFPDSVFEARELFCEESGIFVDSSAVTSGPF